jgi:hypothetical protein
MSLRWIILLVTAASAFAAEYKASDDGRVVYFTGPVADDFNSSRLWRWNNGNIQSLLDAYTPNLPPGRIRLLRLSPDGRFALAHRLFSPEQSTNPWYIFLDGAPRPLVEITGAQLVSMSPNGRWVVVYRFQAGRNVELFELSETGLRSVAVSPSNGRPIIRNLDLPATVSDDAVVRVSCPASLAGCLWDSRSGTTEPERIPFDGTGRQFYFWRQESLGRPLILHNAAGVSLSINCTTEFAFVVATDPAGRRAHLRCGEQDLLYDADTNTAVNLPAEPTLNSSLTAILARPTARQFSWQRLSAPAPEPLGRFETLSLIAAPNPTGLFATSQTPDFAIEWGGQTLSWAQGSLGYHYAFLPADIVPGALDSFRLTSLTRPWLNVQRDRTVARDALAAVPVNAADPRFLFIHQDYSGLVTPDSPARPGERIHLYITGIDPSEIDLTQPDSFAAIFQLQNINLDPQQFSITLRPVDLRPTAYSRSLQLLTLEVPENMAFYSAPTQAPQLALQLRKKAGDALLASGRVWFSIKPN